MPKASRTRPCDSCRKRKTRCIQVKEGLCQYCEKQDTKCVYSQSSHAPSREPTNIEVTPLEHPEPQETGPSYIPDGFDSAALIGTTSDLDPFLAQFYEQDEHHVAKFVNQGLFIVADSIDPFRTATAPVAFSVFRKPQSSIAQADTYRERIDVLVAPFRERLLALYFRFIDWTYPAVDKHSFYQNYYYKKEQLNPALLAGMLALSCIYWKYDSVLCIKPMPAGFTEKLWELCFQCIEDQLEAPTLETMQAILLYLQKRLRRDATAERFAQGITLGKAVSLAYTLGLHVDCTHWRVSDHEKQVRRRLWALVFVNDKWQAANLGRPSLLVGTRGTTRPFESVHPQEQLFVELYRLTEILNGVLDELYSPDDRFTDSSSSEEDSIVKKYLHELAQWWEWLPSDLQTMRHPSKDEFCRNGTLHLSALTVEVLILRRQLTPSKMRDKDFLEWRTRAQDTVQRIIRFTSEITHSHLHAFWLASSSLSFSTLAHFVFYYYVQSSDREKSESNEHFRKWLWALRVLSNAWQEGTGLATLRMDAVFHMGQTKVSIEPPEEPQSLEEPIDAEVEVPVNDEYGLGSIDALLHSDFIPVAEQSQVYASREFHEVPNANPEVNIEINDLFNDNLHDVLLENLFNEHIS